jgi:hypothetical protein
MHFSKANTVNVLSICVILSEGVKKWWKVSGTCQPSGWKQVGESLLGHNVGGQMEQSAGAGPNSRSEHLIVVSHGRLTAGYQATYGSHVSNQMTSSEGCQELLC